MAPVMFTALLFAFPVTTFAFVATGILFGATSAPFLAATVLLILDLGALAMLGFVAAVRALGDGS